MSLSAEFSAFEDSNRGEIRVTAQVAPDWYIYSVTQKRPAKSTNIRLSEDDDYKLAGEWSSEFAPETKYDDLMGVNLEKHFGVVTWSAPVVFSDGVNPKGLEIELHVNGQYCKEACLELKESLTAEFAGMEAAPVAEYRFDNSHVEWSGLASSSAVKPGGKFSFELTGTPDEGWHLYPYAPQPDSDAGVATLIHIRQAHGIKIGVPEPDHEPTEEDVFGEKMLIHHGPTTWKTEFAVPSDLAAGRYEFTGFVGYQVCNDVNCDPPRSAKFTFSLDVANQEDGKAVSLMFVDGPSYNDVGDAATKAMPESDSKKKE